MRGIGITGLAVAVLALPAQAAPVPAAPAAIIPSQGIGPFQLGMSPDQFARARRSAPCGRNVQALFAQRRVIRLETNCGGAYRTETRITVGMDPSRMLNIFGTPDRIVGSDTGGTRGEWLQYLRYGIAFRIVYGDVGYGLIQAIAVFPGTDPRKAPTEPGTPEGPPGPPPGLD